MKQPRAGLYVRVSDPEQAEGYSIEAQLQAGRERATQESWDLQVKLVQEVRR